MSRAALQASNTNVQSVVEGGAINVGSVNLRFGRDICTNNGSAVIKTCGYYDCHQTVTIQPTAAGEVAVKLQHNGVDIPGAIAYGYATAAAQNVTLSLDALLRVTCNNGCPCDSIPDTLTTVLVAGPGDVTSVLTSVSKL